ncbi:nodulation protein NodH [Palleronia sp.]|uniref:nodulation protein NodH n=1 Tax=Palleronia sp. TaxID=1940284 RepID=UPI0035C7F194
MTARFTRFILLAEMRTGSNFLEENLNEIAGVRCWGEAFNPVFVGHAGKVEMAGVTQAERESDPGRLLDAMAAQTEGLSGFRFFHDHDARVLDRLLPEPSCAKIVLTRNPLESYVSLKIARATNQWRLNDMTGARKAKIRFDSVEFAAHVDALRAFQLRVMHILQTTGQTAFYIAYEDLGDLAVLNGLAAWLGVEGRLDKLSDRTKVQNPGALSEKVENYDEMFAALGPTDVFDLGRTPIFEPRRGPAVPSYVAATKAPLLFMPVAGGPRASVEAWLAEIDGVGPEDLGREMTQKDLRKWKRQHPGHRSFTVLRHPVPRLYHTFCRHILMPGPGCSHEIRETLRRIYALPIPEGAPGPSYNEDSHKVAFLAFAAFAKGNLGGQTSLRVDPSWASQSSLLQGMVDFALPDLVLREDEAADRLAELAQSRNLRSPSFSVEPDPQPMPLSAIYDAEVEAAVKAAYQRDYMMFGFSPWG